VIYDPARRAQQLRQLILESMTAEEIEEYNRRTMEPSYPLLKRGLIIRLRGTGCRNLGSS
jgi:hypothetical protein